MQEPPVCASLVWQTIVALCGSVQPYEGFYVRDDGFAGLRALDRIQTESFGGIQGRLFQMAVRATAPVYIR